MRLADEYRLFGIEIEGSSPGSFVAVAGANVARVSRHLTDKVFVERPHVAKRRATTGVPSHVLDRLWNKVASLDRRHGLQHIHRPAHTFDARKHDVLVLDR